MAKTYYVYILASKRNGTLYIGVTNDLARRAWEHREGLVPGFTKTYGVNAGLLRSLRRHQASHLPREAFEEIQTGMEDEFDPTEQCRMAGFDGYTMKSYLGHPHSRVMTFLFYQ
jgi:predicted GIY-YIG superfamily endonuclease